MSPASNTPPTFPSQPTRPETTATVVLRRRPEGTPRPDDFELAEERVPTPGGAELLVGVRYLSLDPYIRSTLDVGHLGEAAVPLGGVLPGRSVGVVLESHQPGLPVGSWVLAETGWRAHAVVPTTSVTPVRLPEDISPSAVLGTLGMPGLTAFAVMERQLQPRPGETVVISAATGGVGTVAGALARAAGARTVALVGSATKAEDARRLGYCAAVVRTAANWEQILADECPDGIHGYVHMADQATLSGVLRRLAVGARVSLCGLMDQYNGATRTVVDAGAVMTARATVHGVVVYDHLDLQPAWVDRAVAGLRSGELRLHEDRHVGLEEAPRAFVRLMAGQNRGKVVVEVEATIGTGPRPGQASVGSPSTSQSPVP